MRQLSETVLDTACEQDELRSELARACERRAATYGLLARMYAREADEDLLREMGAMSFPASTGNADLDAGHRMLATYLSGVWENSVAELAVDYTRTFVGQGVDAFSAAYPYESVYTSERRLMMQDARDEVCAIYRSAGLGTADDWAETEDHVAVELEFMQTLARRTAERLDAGNEEAATLLLLTQRSFLADHLASWAPLLTADMRRFARTGFYRALALMTDGFLVVDGEFLAQVVEEDEGDGDGR